MSTQQSNRSSATGSSANSNKNSQNQQGEGWHVGHSAPAVGVNEGVSFGTFCKILTKCPDCMVGYSGAEEFAKKYKVSIPMSVKVVNQAQFMQGIYLETRVAHLSRTEGYPALFRHIVTNFTHALDDLAQTEPVFAPEEIPNSPLARLSVAKTSSAQVLVTKRY
ncbi:hypothetical protein P154DRAFT_530795 [Amniculicola lignicola CBS 123094]|uniref:Uncharacterized protein n=1 Tax=Amniculicola lignicola CBS 123094 TaxID=1392246 RepID=A0A6A5X103_9PLEO|nr:hypothetical protein P154DRAFT_530795 [Amniculicola lignicola CBS 123094]